MTNTTTLKTLFFEGAGWDGADSSKATDLKNCRIRTAFTNNDGKQIYMELGVKTTYDKKIKNLITEQKLVISSLHYITGGDNDENEHNISHDWKETMKLDYTRATVLNYINENLNCSFEDVQTLPDLAGYRVHADRRGYNYGDAFEYDEALTAKRIEIKKHFEELEKAEGKKYANFSLWVDADDKNILHLLRHFPNLNRHWTINTSGEGWTIEETICGKCAC